MEERKLKDWHGFRSHMLDYASLLPKRRKEFVFRGQSDSKWGLTPTIDRDREFGSDEERELFAREHLDAFREEVLRMGANTSRPSPGVEFELLARHHGLPTQWLDWSESPYVAAFFAYQDPPAKQVKSLAIWMLDRARLDFDETYGISFLNNPELIHLNPRALRQRAVFLGVTTRSPGERLLSKALTKFVLPVMSCGIALAELDEMRINAVDLFGDLDAAARTASYRVAASSKSIRKEG